MTGSTAITCALALNPFNHVDTPCRSSTRARRGQQSPSVMLIVMTAVMHAMTLRLRAPSEGLIAASGRYAGAAGVLVASSPISSSPDPRRVTTIVIRTMQMSPADMASAASGG